MPDKEPTNGLATWKILSGIATVMGIAFVVMGLTFRIHAAQPHDKSVSETEFAVFLQQDIVAMQAIREDIREIRKSLQEFILLHGDE